MAQTATRAPGQGVEWFTGSPVRLSWSAIFGGVFVAMGLWLVLYSLGLALGLSSIDPNNPDGARAVGIGTGVWSVIAPLIALFIGGMVASRTAGIMDKTGGAIHGAVVWSFTTLVGLVLLGMVLSNLFGALTGLTRTVASGAGQAAQQGGSVAQTFGIDANDALAPVNQRLQAEGKPAITAQQLQAATRDVMNTAIREGRLDRELLVSSVAQNTNLSRQDAQEVASRVEQQFNQAQGQAGQSLQRGALQAADTTGKAFWGIFGALALGLVSAVVGATVGVSKRQRVAAEGAVVTREAGVAGRREVYP